MAPSGPRHVRPRPAVTDLVSADAPHVVFAATAALHLGFQATVTFLVYPAFASVAADDWMAFHAAHSRRITPLVAVVYLALGVAAVAVLVTDPSAADCVAVGASGVAVVLTAAVAAPAHGRLAAHREPVALTRLIAADRAPFVAALVAVLAAVVAAG